MNNFFFINTRKAKCTIFLIIFAYAFIIFNYGLTEAKSVPESQTVVDIQNFRSVQSNISPWIIDRPDQIISNWLNENVPFFSFVSMTFQYVSKGESNKPKYMTILFDKTVEIAYSFYDFIYSIRHLCFIVFCFFFGFWIGPGDLSIKELSKEIFYYSLFLPIYEFINDLWHWIFTEQYGFSRIGN